MSSRLRPLFSVDACNLPFRVFFCDKKVQTEMTSHVPTTFFLPGAFLMTLLQQSLVTCYFLLKPNRWSKHSRVTIIFSFTDFHRCS